MASEVKIKDIFSEAIFKSFLTYCKHNNLVYMSDLDKFNFNKLNKSYVLKKDVISKVIKRYDKYKNNNFKRETLEKFASNKKAKGNKIIVENIIDEGMDLNYKFDRMLNFRKTKISEIFYEPVFSRFLTYCEKMKKIYIGELTNMYLSKLEGIDEFSVIIERYNNYKEVYRSIIVELNRHEQKKYNLKIENVFYEDKFYTFLDYCKKSKLEYMSDLINFDFTKLYKNEKTILKGKTIFNVLRRYNDYMNGNIRFKIDNIFKDMKYSKLLGYCRNKGLKYVDELCDFSTSKLRIISGCRNIDELLEFIGNEINLDKIKYISAEGNFIDNIKIENQNSTKENNILTIDFDEIYDENSGYDFERENETVDIKISKSDMKSSKKEDSKKLLKASKDKKQDKQEDKKQDKQEDKKQDKQEDKKQDKQEDKKQDKQEDKKQEIKLKTSSNKNEEINQKHNNSNDKINEYISNNSRKDELALKLYFDSRIDEINELEEKLKKKSRYIDYVECDLIVKLEQVENVKYGLERKIRELENIKYEIDESLREVENIKEELALRTRNIK